jgi:hypothetical protein
VRRLQATEPAYPVDRLDAERRATEDLLKSICHYPYQSGTWAKERRHKTKLLTLTGEEKSASLPASALGGSRSRSELAHTAPAQLEMRPDESGLITFEIVAADYSFPAGDFEIPLSGSLPFTVDVDSKAILALSSASEHSVGGGALTIRPSKAAAGGGRGGARAKPKPVARR